MIIRIVAMLVAGVWSAAIASGPSMSGKSASHVQTTRYLGTPALALTAALVAAGGGAKHFNSLRLIAALTGPRKSAELHALAQRFGQARVAAFAITFNHAIDDSLVAAEAAHVSLPPAPPALLNHGGDLAAHLVAAGVMPNGRFDVGYMIEHLVSRKIHVIIMRRLNADPAVGPQRNAEFHIILASFVGDLRTQYGL